MKIKLTTEAWESIEEIYIEALKLEELGYIKSEDEFYEYLQEQYIDIYEGFAI